MATNLSRADIERFKNRVQSQARTIGKYKEKAEAIVTSVVRTAEVAAGAFLSGFSHGKWDGIQLGGVPAEVLAATAAHLVSFTGVLGSAGPHAAALGDGLLAGWVTTVAFKVGNDMKLKEGASALSQGGGQGGGGGGGSIQGEGTRAGFVEGEGTHSRSRMTQESREEMARNRE